MQKELFTSFNTFGKSAIDSAKELVAINGRLLTNTLNSQIKFASLVIEGSEKELGSFVSSADMKDPQTFFKSQTELFEEYAGLMKEQLGATAEVAKQASEEFAVWLKETVETGDKSLAEIAKVAPPAPVKKVVAKTAPVKKAAAKKAPVKKAAVKKPVAKKAASKAKPVAKKTVAAKKPATKKAKAAAA